MNSFKSHFLFDKRKRSGILLLCTLIIGVLSFLFWYTPKKESIISTEEAIRVAHFQRKIDSLKQIEQERRKPKIYPFSPNFITDYRGYTLGMTIEEIDRLKRFRKSDKWVNSVADFKRVTQVSDSLLAEISPYFKFPDWVTNPKTVKSGNAKKKWKTPEEKKDLNKISFEALMQLEGMEAEAAHKIIKHHKKLRGYLIDKQIYDVYGVPTKFKRKVLNQYTVKTKPTITLLDVNTSTASDLSTVPLLNFDLAKEIVDYRILREGIKSLEELKDLEGMTDYKFERIRLYLKV